jgi:hypothetical protein
MLAIAALPAAAANFCIHPQQTAADINSVLDAARTNGEVEVIRFESGTYPLEAELVYDMKFENSDHSSLTLSGGYDSECIQRVGTTELDGGNQHRVLRLRMLGEVTASLDHFNIVNGHADDLPGLDGYGGGLLAQLDSQSALGIESMRFIANHAYIDGGALAIWPDTTGHVSIRNSFFFGNANEGVGGSAAAVYTKGTVYLTGNTFTSNSPVFATAAVYLHAVSPDSNIWLSNNILWGNGAATQDLYMVPPPDAGGSYHLVANDIGIQAGATPAPDSTGNLSVDPLFACSLCSTDKPLAATSPLIDVGTDEPEGGLPYADLLGRARIMGTHVDMGAYEVSVPGVPNAAPFVVPDQAFEIAADAAPDDVVGAVQAVDDTQPSPHALIYKILDGNIGDAFAINPNTGVLAVQSPLSGGPLAYDLTIEVSDGELAGSGTVMVDVAVGNQAPQIDAGQVFTIAEDAATEKVLFKIQASDDGKPQQSILTYAITAGNTGGVFSIDSETGEVHLVAGAALDADVQPSYTLTIEVSDGELMGSGNITVLVIDPSDIIFRDGFDEPDA